MYLSSRLQHRLSRELWLSILQKKMCREGIQNRLQQDNLSGKLYTPSTCVRLAHIASPILTSTINVTGILLCIAYHYSWKLFYFYSYLFQFCICTCVYINIYIFFSFIAEIPLSRFRTFAIKIPLFRYPCTVPFILGILFWYLCVVAYFWNSSFLSPFFSFKNFPFSMELSP